MKMHIPKTLAAIAMAMLLGSCAATGTYLVTDGDGNDRAVLLDGTVVQATNSTWRHRDGSYITATTTFQQQPACQDPTAYNPGVCGGSMQPVDTVGVGDRGIAREVLGHAVHLGSYLGGAAIIGGAGDVINNASATAGAFAKHGGKKDGPPGPGGPPGPPHNPPGPPFNPPGPPFNPPGPPPHVPPPFN